MEKHILALEASGDRSWSEDADSLEDKALELAIDEIYQANGQKWKPWAKNARSIRVGDLILIVDSDTIVPEVSTSYYRILHTLMSLRSGLFQRCCS